MGLVFAYVIGVFSSALPARYRKWRTIEGTAFRGPGIISGIVQFQAAIFISIFRYLDFFEHRVGSFGRTLIDAGRENFLAVDTIQYGMGFLTSAEYLLHPLSLFFLYLAFEGLMRSIGALATGEPLPTLPLFLIAEVHTKIDAWREQRALGPLICDQIEVGKGTQFDLRVSSCRPKKDWSPLIMIRFEDAFYEMFMEESGSLPRRFVYNLRKNPVGRLVVDIREYKPDDVIRVNRKV